MKIGKSEELNPVVHADHLCTPPPHVFSHVFCDLIKKNSALSKRNIISILQMRQQTDKKYLRVQASITFMIQFIPGNHTEKIIKWTVWNLLKLFTRIGLNLAMKASDK